jgi:hypothetical protein
MAWRYLLMKGWRTVAFNVVTLLTVMAGVVLQYVDMLGLEDSTAAMIGLSLTMFNAVANIWLRSITTTPMGKAL